MVTIGVDAHKRVHMAVVIDTGGREVMSWRGANTPAGWAALQHWAASLDGERRWGIEGTGQYGHGLAQTLVTAGEPVVEVNPRLTAGMRRGGRARGKSDRLDALAVARVVAQEGAGLPTVHPDDASTVLAELVADRESARAEATRIRNQLHQVLARLGGVDARPWPDLTDSDAVATLTTYQPPTADPLAGAQVMRAATQRVIVQLSRPHLGPLLAVCGVAPLTAGMLAAELGTRHFATDAQLASYAGVAPVEASSGEHTRHRLNRTGNRQLNAIVHRIALVQSRCSPDARAYLAKQQAAGKTKREAIRALKRYIVRAVFRAWQQCTLPPLTTLEVPLT